MVFGLVVGTGVAMLMLAFVIRIFQIFRPHVPNTCENARDLRIECVASRLFSVVFWLLFFLENNYKYSIVRRLCSVAYGRTSNDPDIIIVQIEQKTFSLRVYTPRVLANVQNNSVIFYMHGGGYVLGGCIYYEDVLTNLALRAGCVLIGVNYRLAPEHPYPVPNDDVSDAYEYMIANSSALCVDIQKIVCFGDSAGGHASLVLNARLHLAHNTHLPLAQVLFYPATQWYSFNTPSYQTYRNCGEVFPSDDKDMMCAYLGIDKGDVDLIVNDRHVTEDVCLKLGICFPATNSKQICYSPVDGVPLHTKYARLHENTDISPLFSNALHHQPYTILVTATYDTLRDDGKMMIEKLKSVGVRTKYLQVDSLHGFLSYLFYHKPAVSVFDEVIRDIKEIFGKNAA